MSVIIPTYNERENLKELLARVSSSLRGVSYEVIIVDDSSPDGTVDLALALSREFPIRVIIRPPRSGLSSAVLDGFRAARGDVLCVMDADLQHPPELLPELYRGASSCDIVIASRYIEGGSVEGWSSFRKLISRGSILLARLLIPKVRKIKDVSSGYFAVRRDCLNLDEMNPKGFKILLEVLVKGNWSSFIEVPYAFGLRRSGRSKLGIKTILSYLLHVLELSSPFLRFGIVGATGTLVNLISLWLMRYLLMFEHEPASIVAIELSLINNFILNDVWTFRKRRRRGFLRSLLSYHVTNFTGIMTQFITSTSLHRLLGLESLLSQFIGIVFGFIVNYSLSRRLVWW
ncbi:MAG: glycosyltransferase family 2 protein [Candidatus Korarchaeum sp.]|nr:glycosyltransferase family 2 protein [Candidatus Korarchaeum sp.]